MLNPDRVIQELAPWHAAGARMFSLGNEPNAGAAPGDEDVIWRWRWSLEQTIRACRQSFPGALLVVGNLMVDQHDRFRRWLEIAADVLVTADGIGLHAYEHFNFDNTPGATRQLDRALAAGREYCPLRPIHITEYGIHDPATSDAVKGAYYGRLVRRLRAMPGVASATYYHLCTQPLDADQASYALDAAGEATYAAALSVVSPPQTHWLPSPNFGYPTGSHGRKNRQPKAIVIHIAEGRYGPSLSWLRNPASGVSAHYLIGPSGVTANLVHPDDAAWANGLFWDAAGRQWLTPAPDPAHRRPVSPTWEVITPGVNPNLETISIEHAGWHTQAWPAAQVRASVALLAHLGQRYPQLTPFVLGKTLIRHADINPIDKARCPGSLAPMEQLAATANALLEQG